MILEPPLLLGGFQLMEMKDTSASTATGRPGFPGISYWALGVTGSSIKEWQKMNQTVKNLRFFNFVGLDQS